jgi:hypothetical protein
LSSPVQVAPAFRALPPPIIVVGMHRSGTSMVVGMLSLLGVFLDPAFQLSPDRPLTGALSAQLRTDGYGEATAFRLLNEAVMARAGANWFHVSPFLAVRDEPRFAAVSIERMRRATYQELDRDYLRLRPEPLSSPWGWKDPRNSLTLPYWLRLFPEARILHVHRQPEAVVRSLTRRAAGQNETPAPPPGIGTRAGNLLRNPHQLIGAVGRRLGLAAPPPAAAPSLSDRDYCLRLTEQYVQECNRHRALGDRYLELAYEEIVTNPQRTVSQLVRFAQLQPDDQALRRAAEFVDDPSRRSAQAARQSNPADPS